VITISSRIARQLTPGRLFGLNTDGRTMTVMAIALRGRTWGPMKHRPYLASALIYLILPTNKRLFRAADFCFLGLRRCGDVRMIENKDLAVTPICR
jgi:hypothetical protein